MGAIMSQVSRDQSIRRNARAMRWRSQAWCLFALMVAGCSTGGTEPKDAVVSAPTVSSDDLLTAAETDIAARRFQLAYQRLTRLDQAALETPRAKLVQGEVLLGLNSPKEALGQFQLIQSDEAYQARAFQGM